MAVASRGPGVGDIADHLRAVLEHELAALHDDVTAFNLGGDSSPTPVYSELTSPVSSGGARRQHRRVTGHVAVDARCRRRSPRRRSPEQSSDTCSPVARMSPSTCSPRWSLALARREHVADYRSISDDDGAAHGNHVALHRPMHHHRATSRVQVPPSTTSPASPPPSDLVRTSARVGAATSMWHRQQQHTRQREGEPGNGTFSGEFMGEPPVPAHFKARATPRPDRALSGRSVAALVQGPIARPS